MNDWVTNDPSIAKRLNAIEDAYTSSMSPVTGLDIWAPYLIDGDASGLDADEKAMADNWLKRNNIEFVEGCTEPYFTWNMVLYVPGCTKSTGMVVDYVCKLKAE